MKFTEQILKDLKKKGTIRGYKIMSKPRPRAKVNGKIVSKHFKKRSKEKNWIGLQLFAWCQEKAVILRTEYIFDINGRKWSFDYCIEDFKIAIEYNGIMSEKSRHTSITGYTEDMNKITAASKQGWIILQYTPLNYRKMVKDLDEIYNNLNKNK